MTTDDPLLKKAREAEESARQASTEAEQISHKKNGISDKFQVLKKIFQLFYRFIHTIGLAIAWLAKKAVTAFKWAGFKREQGEFLRDQNSKLVFSAKRLAIASVSLVASVVLAHIALSAAYFYGTQFEELVYTTGKQEINTGERYQFTGCTSLPCSTDEGNGKFYEIESSWYFPYLVYPEEDVYANIPQQDGACEVKGYGFYMKELKTLHRSAQWYQKVYNISCRPYTEEEKQKALDSGQIIKPSANNSEPSAVNSN